MTQIQELSKPVDKLKTEWQTVRLGDVATVKSGYAFKSNDWQTYGIPVIKITNVKDGRIVLDGCSFVSQEVAKKAKEFQLRQGDILIAMTGYVGDVAVVRNEPPMVLNQRVGKFFVQKPDRLDSTFLFYFLRNPETKQRIENLGYGSAQANVSPTLIQGMEFPLPSLSEQRSIASILGSLDDKIELNRQMNETLEQMARALFRAWFVDFDPVRARAEGRDTGLPKEIADLFPDSFEDSELGEIPKGWRVSVIGEEFNLTMGQSPPGETYNEAGEGLPFFQGRTDFGFRFPLPRVYCSEPTRLANEGDTLVSVRAPVGSVNMATAKSCIGRGVAAIRHKSNSRSFTYYFMRYLEPVFAQFEAGGTVFGSINKADFNGLSCITPSERIIEAFEKCIFSVDEQIEVNERQTGALASMRDALLPKLLSGEDLTENL